METMYQKITAGLAIVYLIGSFTFFINTSEFMATYRAEAPHRMQTYDNINRELKTLSRILQDATRTNIDQDYELNNHEKRITILEK